MRFPKILIPFLAVVLPTVHFAHNDATDNNLPVKKSEQDDEEIYSDESQSHSMIFRAFTDSERFLRFAGHSSHSSHSSHQSHSSHTSGSHNSGSDCNGCLSNVDDEDWEENSSSESLVAIK